jgi:hypothetical protein
MISEPGRRSLVAAMTKGPREGCFGCCLTWLQTVGTESEVEKAGGDERIAEGAARCGYIRSLDLEQKT